MKHQNKKTKQKIMIVEDEIVIANALAGLIEEFGYTVCANVTTGEEAIELQLRTDPNLILMDVVLAGNLDGTGAAARIRENSNVPIIFLSAYSDEHNFSKAKESGPSSYLLKPYSSRSLEMAIHLALHNAKSKKKSSEYTSGDDEVIMKYTLSPSEAKVAELIIDSKTSKKIAERLSISEHTVYFHRKNIRNKFGIQNKKVNLTSFLQTKIVKKDKLPQM